MKQKISQVIDFIEKNPNPSYEDIIKNNDAELELLIALEVNFNDFSLFDQKIEFLIQNSPLKERIQRYHNSPLFNLLVDFNLESAICCLELKGEFEETGTDIINELYIQDDLFDLSLFFTEIQELDLFSKNFPAVVRNINLMLDDTRHEDPFEEIEEEIARDNIELENKQEHYYYKKLKLHRFSELYFRQKEELIKIIENEEATDDSLLNSNNVPHSIQHLKTISDIYLHGVITKSHVDMKIDLSILENALGKYKIKKDPWIQSLEKSAKDNMKKAGKDLALELALDAGFSLIPVLGPMIKTGLTKGVSLGKDILADASSNRNHGFSFEKEEVLFSNFLKSEHKEIESFLQELAINDLKNLLEKEYNYEVKHEEEKMLSLLASSITKKIIQTNYSRLNVIQDSSIKKLIEDSSGPNKDTLVYIAVNSYLFDDFIESREIKNLFKNKNLPDLTV